MSTLKTTNLQHPSAGSPAIVLDADGDATYAGVHDFSAATVTGVGKILQVVRATDTTDRTTTSTSYVDASISVTITPQKSTSALIVIWNTIFFAQAANQFIRSQITDSSNVAISGALDNTFGQSGNNLLAMQTQIGYATPATTSAVTFKGRYRSEVGGSVSLLNGRCTAQMYAIEVSA